MPQVPDFEYLRPSLGEAVSNTKELERCLLQTKPSPLLALLTGFLDKASQKHKDCQWLADLTARIKANMPSTKAGLRLNKNSIGTLIKILDQIDDTPTKTATTRAVQKTDIPLTRLTRTQIQLNWAKTAQENRLDKFNNYAKTWQQELQHKGRAPAGNNAIYEIKHKSEDKNNSAPVKLGYTKILVADEDQIKTVHLLNSATKEELQAYGLDARGC